MVTGVSASRISCASLALVLCSILAGCGDDVAAPPVEWPPAPQFELSFSGIWNAPLGGGPPVAAAVGPDHHFYLTVDAFPTGQYRASSCSPTSRTARLCRGGVST